MGRDRSQRLSRKFYVCREGWRDRRGTWGGDFTYDNKPVVFLSWFDTIRFANWLHNGQGSGDTETGAYTLLGGTPVPSNANIITRNPGARWWLPSEDEWYKAAYYDPIAEVYYDYPTGTSGRPNNNLPSADTGNSMNAGRHSRSGVGVPSYPWTDVGAYTLSASPYGTFDQGGNAEEWNETLSRFGEATKWRGLRGGPWNESHLHALGRGGNAADPTSERYGYGFRVATVVPEPSVRALLALGALTLICRKRSTRSQCWVKTD
ncbi:MAG TPA: SUMF1/EgtB/PvdO family nonheme iron enzyme [Lacipirellulaceae bacterium]